MRETPGGEGSPSKDSPGVLVAFPAPEEPLPRLEQLRARMTPSRRYEPISEDEKAERLRVLAEQAKALLGEALP